MSKGGAAVAQLLKALGPSRLRPRIVRQRPYGPNSPPTFYVELPNLFVYDQGQREQARRRGTMKEVIQLLAMTFHKTYESNPGSFEFTFSKEMPVIPGFAFACDTHFVVRAPQDSTGSACVLVMTHEEARERYAGYMNTCYIQGACPRHRGGDRDLRLGPPFRLRGGRLYAFNLVGPWNFCDKPVFDREPRAEIEPPSEGAMLQYCGIIKGQSGTGKSMVTQIMTECCRRAASASNRPSKGSAFSEHGGEEAICMVMAEGLDPKACSEEELKMRSGDAYSRNFKNVRGDDVRTKRRASSRTACSSSSPALVLIPLDHKPAKKRTYLHSDIRENELRRSWSRPSLRVKIIHALSDGKASCIQRRRAGVARAQRLGFWQETASCPLTRFIIAHCAVDPTTYVAAPTAEG
eukprot:tig00020829_g14381.t1